MGACLTSLHLNIYSEWIENRTEQMDFSNPSHQFGFRILWGSRREPSRAVLELHTPRESIWGSGIQSTRWVAWRSLRYRWIHQQRALGFYFIYKITICVGLIYRDYETQDSNLVQTFTMATLPRLSRITDNAGLRLSLWIWNIWPIG